MARGRYPLIAPLLVLGMVFNPLLSAAVNEDIHTTFLMAATAGIAFYALQKERYRLMVAALALTLLAREDMPIYVGSFGLFLFLFRPGQRRLGFAIGVVSVAWLVATTFVIMPALNSGAYRHSDQTTGMLAGLNAALATITTQPQNALPPFLDSTFVRGLLEVLVPLALLPLLAGEYAVLWFPGLLVLLLSPEASGFGSGSAWRLAPLLPLWFGSAAIGLNRLGRRPALVAAVVMVVLSLVAYRLWGLLPGSERFDATQYAVSAHTEAVKRVLGKVTPDLAVTASDHVGAQLGARERSYLFPFFETSNPPDIAIVDASGNDLYPLNSVDKQKAAIDQLRTDPAVKAIWFQDDIYVFSFTDKSPFVHNFGVPMAAYKQALAKARTLLATAPGSTVYLRAAVDIAPQVETLGAQTGLAVRVSTSPYTLLLAGTSTGDQLYYVVPSEDKETVSRLQALGFLELTNERINLPGGVLSLGFYRLAGKVRDRLAGAIDRQGPDLRLANGLRLWRWQGPADAKGQSAVPLTMAWEVWDTPKPLGGDADYCMSEHQVDVDGTAVALIDAEFELTRYLDVGDIVVTWPQVPIESDVEQQQVWVQAGVFGCWHRETAEAVDGSGKPAPEGIRVGPLEVGMLPVATLPTYRVRASVGDAVQFRGYDATAEVKAGRQQLNLRLHWRAKAVPNADYTVFVQLLGPNGVVAQDDGPPLEGRYPTSAWDKDQIIEDPRTLTPSAPLAPGEYRLIAGMYTPADVRRLPVKQSGVQSASDYVDLGVVVVGADGTLKVGK